jgi:hypothetical protein
MTHLCIQGHDHRGRDRLDAWSTRVMLVDLFAGEDAHKKVESEDVNKPNHTVVSVHDGPVNLHARLLVSSNKQIESQASSLGGHARLSHDDGRNS